MSTLRVKSGTAACRCSGARGGTSISNNAPAPLRRGARAFRAPSLRVSFKEVILPSHLALNADHRAIGGLHVSSSIQRYSDGKFPWLVTSNNLNAGDGLTTGPMSDGRKALLPESPVR